jgi:hypothetical protein
MKGDAEDGQRYGRLHYRAFDHHYLIDAWPLKSWHSFHLVTLLITLAVYGLFRLLRSQIEFSIIRDSLPSFLYAFALFSFLAILPGDLTGISKGVVGFREQAVYTALSIVGFEIIGPLFTGVVGDFTDGCALLAGSVLYRVLVGVIGEKSGSMGREKVPANSGREPLSK